MSGSSEEHWWAIEYHPKGSDKNDYLSHWHIEENGGLVVWTWNPNQMYRYPSKKEAEAVRKKLLKKYDHIKGINRRIVVRRHDNLPF